MTDNDKEPEDELNNDMEAVEKADHEYEDTRRYGALRAPTSSSCGGLVAFGHLWGPFGPLSGGLRPPGGPYRP